MGDILVSVAAGLVLMEDGCFCVGDFLFLLLMRRMWIEEWLMASEPIHTRHGEGIMRKEREG